MNGGGDYAADWIISDYVRTAESGTEMIRSAVCLGTCHGLSDGGGQAAARSFTGRKL